MAEEPTHDDRRRMWGRVAKAYESNPSDGPTAGITDWLVAASRPQPGQVVLDVAAGAGDVAHRVAVEAGSSCQVVCSDFAPEMVEAARRVGAALGLDNVEYRVLDAEQMDLDDDSIDTIVCRSALMLMPAPDAALAEFRRVLRPGGVLAASVFSAPATNPWVVIPTAVFAQRGLIERPDPSGPGMFSLGDPERLAGLATEAGFTDVDTEPIDFVFDWPDEDAVWRIVAEVNAMLRPVVAALAPDERNAARRAVMNAFEPYKQRDGSFDVPAQALGLVAR